MAYYVYYYSSAQSSAQLSLQHYNKCVLAVNYGFTPAANNNNKPNHDLIIGSYLPANIQRIGANADANYSFETSNAGPVLFEHIGCKCGSFPVI